MLTNQVSWEDFTFYVTEYAKAGVSTLNMRDTKTEGVVTKREFIDSETGELVAFATLCPKSEGNHRYHLIIANG